MNRVPMNLQRIGSVLEVISHPGTFRRQLLRLAHRDEPRPQRIGQRRSEYKPPRLDSQHHVDTESRILILQTVDDAAQALLVLQKGSDVVKEDPCLGKIGNFTDE